MTGTHYGKRRRSVDRKRVEAAFAWLEAPPVASQIPRRKREELARPSIVAPLFRELPTILWRCDAVSNRPSESGGADARGPTHVCAHLKGIRSQLPNHNEGSHMGHESNQSTLENMIYTERAPVFEDMRPPK